MVEVEEAKRYIAGGVNSPVRSFKSVGGEPIFMKSGKGSKIYSEDGREFIDYCLSWGALILGHSHTKVIEGLKSAIDKGTSFGAPTRSETVLARFITDAMPSIERVRLTNSGTEAVMGAVRLARAYAKRDKIIKFDGAYHGHADYLLDCPGVPQDFTRDTLRVPYNDIEKVKTLASRYKNEIACIIVEPVACNMGAVLPKDDFLSGLKDIAERERIILIFDEVITGFRLSYGGAQSVFKITPDLTCLGKIIGGGLPVGAFGGREDIMRLLAPEGPVVQAGTFSGNPVTVTAGIITLRILKEENPYEKLERLTKRLCEGMRSKAGESKLDLKINQIASIFSVFFTKEDVIDYRSVKRQDAESFKRFFHGLLKEGVYLSPSGYEALFLSTAHTAQDVDRTLKAVDKVFYTLSLPAGRQGDDKMGIAIILNGKKEEIKEGMNIAGLLQDKNIRPEVVTVELNDSIVDRSRYKKTALKDKDRIEFVYYMGGGTPFSDRVADNILELICETPMVRLNKVVKPGMAKIIAKLENFNPGGSVKDRICLSMIEDAEKKGLIKKGGTIIEPTSGNTGIGLAMVAAVKGYRCVLTLPETMSLERIYILKAYGAEVVLTPGIDGMKGAIKRAEQLHKKMPHSFMPQQFKNLANPEIHRRTTANEILKAVGGTKIDAFVIGVGTGGTITGVGEILKKKNPNVKIVAVEPKSSAVLSGNPAGPHKIQGIGAGFVPKVLDKNIIDAIIQVSDDDAFNTSRILAKEEGLFVGISAGAAAWAAFKVAKELGEGKLVVTVFPDTGERYFSMEQYFKA